MTIAFGLMGAIVFAECSAILYLQSTRCPSGAFLSGSPRLAAIFVMVAPGFSSIGLGLMAANFLTGSSPQARRFFDGDRDLRGSQIYRQEQRGMLRLSAALIAIFLPLSFVASFSQYCLTPTVILDRSAPWSAMRAYAWRSVGTITTSCTPGRKGRWNASYVLGFPDGRTLDLFGGTASIGLAKDQVLTALRGGNFKFDATKVSPACGNGWLDLLTHRP